MELNFDVAIVGGGPAGATVGCFLKKYDPSLRVAIFERENFPRDHVGESLLPIVSIVLDEMGCWDKVEREGFPVKIGATYRWGSTQDLWDFDFLNGQSYDDAPRPAKFDGQRRKTAFQVDRSIYDKVLLDHARSAGVVVQEGVKVSEVHFNSDTIDHIVLGNGDVVRARIYVDASGYSGIVRRSLGVNCDEPSRLKNIAIWSYWQNADWAVSLGVSGTRIQVMSLGWGWIWFIPVGPSRTSIGLVLPVQHFKALGLSAQEVYLKALTEESRISNLLDNAEREPKISTTSDWSFVASRMTGENWILVGEAAGFADPILSAGLTLAHVGGWEAAITIIERFKGNFDKKWLNAEYERQQTRRIKTHIQFADFWYRANSRFTDLIENVKDIAKDSGLALDGQAAWRWLGAGGFVDTDLGGAGIGGFSLISASWLVGEFTAVPANWNIGKYNYFMFDPSGAEEGWILAYRPGYVERLPSLNREGRCLPTTATCGYFINKLRRATGMNELLKDIQDGKAGVGAIAALQVLEAMINDGWVEASFDPRFGVLDTTKLTSAAPFGKNSEPA